MEKIMIDEEYKKKIYEHIQRNIGYYHDKYANEIQSLISERTLDKDFATRILENLVYSCKVEKLQLKPSLEFEDELTEANKLFNAVPKSPDYNETEYVRDSNVEKYNEMNFGEIFSHIKNCLSVEEIFNKVHSIQNLRQRATEAINSIDSIDKHKTEITIENTDDLIKVGDELKELMHQTRTDTKAIQNKIRTYNEQANKIWTNYLSTDSKQPKWLVHNLSRGGFQGKFDKKYMSSSLVTNKTMGLFNESKGNNFGFIIKPKNIISASEHDTFTNNSPVINEYMDTFANGDTPPIKLPWEIEENCVKQTIQNSGEMLNYDNKTVYPEIVVDDFEIEAMYYRSNGEGELAPNYDIAKKMAEERGIELRELDISKAREEQGLDPMTESMQKNFLRNILRKNFMNEEQIQATVGNKFSGTTEIEEQFIESHYKEFYQRYLHLRENGEFTKKGILQEFNSIVSEKEMEVMNTHYSQQLKDMYQYETYSQEENNFEEPVVDESEHKQTETELWTNRFKGWYEVIDKIPNNVRGKFIQMKAEIVKTIKSIFRDREISMHKNVKNPDTNER